MQWQFGLQKRKRSSAANTSFPVLQFRDAFFHPLIIVETPYQYLCIELDSEASGCCVRKVLFSHNFIVISITSLRLRPPHFLCRPIHITRSFYCSSYLKRNMKLLNGSLNRLNQSHSLVLLVVMVTPISTSTNHSLCTPRSQSPAKIQL